VRFDDVNPGPACEATGDLTEAWLCGPSGFGPGTQIVWPYLTEATNSTGTSCNAISLVDEIDLNCTTGYSHVPTAVVSCDVCQPQIDLSSYLTVYGPLWLTADETTVNADCAVGWVYFLNVSTAVLSQDVVCQYYGNGPFFVSFIIDVASGSELETQTFTFASTVTSMSYFGSECTVEQTIFISSGNAPLQQRWVLIGVSVALMLLFVAAVSALVIMGRRYSQVRSSEHEYIPLTSFSTVVSGMTKRKR